MERNNSIDLIKGLCAICVIITHFSWTQTERLKMLFPFWIDMVIPMFMALSGYVYANSFLKNNIESIEKAYHPFIISKRILKLMLPYGICFMVEVILDMLYSPRESIFNIVARFFRGGYGPGGYYCPIMIQFIFVFPVIFKFVKKYNHCGLLACGLINVLYEIMKIVYFVDEKCYRLLIFRYIFIIAYGCYLRIQEPKHKWNWELGACFI